MAPCPGSEKRRTAARKRRSLKICKTDDLALRELEALAGAGLAVLLALDFARVAGEQAGAAKRGLVFLVVFDEGAGEAETDGTGLAGKSAADRAHADVELALRLRNV